jgi:hypothetical protein
VTKKKSTKTSHAAEESAEPVATVAEQPVINAVKGFDLQMQCRGYQFKVGESYEHNGPVVACESGFHSIEGNPLEVFDYYAPSSSVYAEVEASGEIARHSGDSKIASGKLHIKVGLSLPDIIGRAIAWVTAQCTPADAQHATGDQSASSATGDQSASSATGDQSASSATGYRSASSATGDQSASSATGDQSASSATGYRSASSATGDRSASLSTGWCSSAEIKPGEEPLQAVAIAVGYKGRARAPTGSAIVLCERDDKGVILHIRASRVGDNGIKADVWYVLKDGEFVESMEAE